MLPIQGFGIGKNGHDPRIRDPSIAISSRETSSATDSDRGRMSAALRRRVLFIFPELKVANFALLLSVR